jgi:hypothetical protein
MLFSILRCYQSYGGVSRFRGVVKQRVAREELNVGEAKLTRKHGAFWSVWLRKVVGRLRYRF